MHYKLKQVIHFRIIFYSKCVPHCEIEGVSKKNLDFDIPTNLETSQGIEFGCDMVWRVRSSKYVHLFYICFDVFQNLLCISSMYEFENSKSKSIFKIKKKNIRYIEESLFIRFTIKEKKNSNIKVKKKSLL